MWSLPRTCPTQPFIIFSQALQRDERVMVVWSDNLDSIIPLCRDFEAKLMKLVWKARRTIGSSIFGSAATSTVASTTGSIVSLPSISKVQQQQGTAVDAPAVVAALAEQQQPKPQPKAKRTWWGWRLSPKPASAAQSEDVEKGFVPELRPMRMFSPIYTGLACALSICRCFQHGTGIHSPPCRFLGGWCFNHHSRVQTRRKCCAVRLTGCFSLLGLRILGE